MKMMTMKEALEMAGLEVKDYNDIGEWWSVERNGYLYIIHLVNGYTDYNTRYHVSKYTCINGKYSNERKLCTRANFNTMVNLIKGDK